MELSYVGPILNGMAVGLMVGIACYIYAAILQAIPFKSFSHACDIFAIIFFMSVSSGVMAFWLSSGLYFNREYYEVKHNEAMERKSIIEDSGYEYWSEIDSRPIQKSKIHSCHGTSLVTDREYKEVDIESNEVKESKVRLHVFCKLNGQGEV